VFPVDRVCGGVLVGVVGEFKPGNKTHDTLNESLRQVAAEAEWIPTDAVPPPDALSETYAGIWIAPASPYRSMDGALSAIRTARERGVPLVGT
jgi:CTP synthase (UTP-ammonia lyase)